MIPVFDGALLGVEVDSEQDDLAAALQVLVVIAFRANLFESLLCRLVTFQFHEKYFVIELHGDIDSSMQLLLQI